jgi:hypothetical protein
MDLTSWIFGKKFCICQNNAYLCARLDRTTTDWQRVAEQTKMQGYDKKLTIFCFCQN